MTDKEKRAFDVANACINAAIEISESLDKRNYYNTNNEIGTELKKSQEKAKSQDELVLLFFKEHDQLGVTPERVLRHFQIMEPLSSDKWAKTPITSIRRSFSNLHKKGLIEKTGYKIEGDFGKQINVWRCK